MSNHPQLNDNSNEVSLIDLWVVIYTRRKLIVAFACLGTVLGVVFGLLAKPQFTAVAVVAYDPEKGGESFSLDDLTSALPGGSDTKTKVETEVRILESASLGADVIERLHLEQNPAFFKNPRKLRQGSVEFSGELTRAWSKSIAVRSLPKTNLIEIKFTGPDSKLDQLIVNTLVDAYIERNFRVKYDSVTKASDWLGKQLADIKQKTEASEKALAEYQKKTGIIIVNGVGSSEDPKAQNDSGTSIVLSQLEDIDTAYSAAKVARIQKEAIYRLSLSSDPEVLAEVVPGSTLPAMRAQQADVRNQYALSAAKFGPKYPKTSQLKAQLDQMDKSIKEEIERTREHLRDEFEAAKNAESALTTQLDGLTKQAYSLNDSAIQLKILQREAEANRLLYDDLLKRLNEAGVVASLKSTNVTIVDDAVEPDRPSSISKRIVVLLGLCFGLIVGLVVAFVLDSVHDTVDSIEDAEAAAGTPVVGIVPEFEENAKKSRENKGTSAANADSLGRYLFVLAYPISHIAESFRAIRTAVLLSRADHPPKTMVITSSLPGEGKSTVAVNLALVFAQRDARVLLIDGDMRKGRLHRFLEIDGSTGLSAVLSGGVKLKDAITALPACPNLTILPCGMRPPNSSELFDSIAMSNLLEEATQMFDLIIIDTPPVLLVTDAVILADKVDVTLIVTRSRVTRRGALQRLVGVLGASGANLVGTVLNGVDMGSPGSYAGYYYRGSDYYGSYGDNDADKDKK